METRTAPMIELLSLGQESSRYLMEVELTLGDRHARRVMDLDEFTYNRLSELRLGGRGRIRLSPYRKWDPFRQSSYSTLTALNGSLMEKLYFACTEYYGDQLLRLTENGSIAPEAPADKPAVNRPEGEKAASDRRLRTGRGRSRAVRWAVVCAFMFCMFIRMDNEVFTWQAEALGRYVNATGSGPMPSAVPTGSEGQEPVAEADPPAYEAAGPEGAGPAGEPATVITPASANAPSADSATVETSSLPSAAAPEVPEVLKAPEAAHAERQVEAAAAAEVFDIGMEKNYYSLPKGYVALTFDDGPSVYTQKLVDILEEHGVAATFLFIGKNAEKHPEAVTYTFEHGMAVGNHSWDHSKLTDSGGIAQQENIRKSNRLLESLTGAPVTLFRPPYGATNPELEASVKERQMKVLMWNRDPEDWNARTEEDILRYIYEADPSGGLYVMHEDKLTVHALPAIIRYFQEKKLQFAIFK